MGRLGKGIKDGVREIPKEFLELADPSSFYPSLALLCMLVELTEGSGLKIAGGFGFWRGQNLSDASSGMTVKGDGVSDHAFGRGFDIDQIGEGQSLIKFDISIPDDYYQGLDMLLAKIATLPKFLQPDSIVFSSVMITYFNTQDDDTIMKNYPGLGPHIDFGFDDTSIHNGHIHLSFGWTRAGHPDKLSASSYTYQNYNTSDTTFPDMNTGTSGIYKPENYSKYMYLDKYQYQSTLTLTRSTCR